MRVYEKEVQEPNQVTEKMTTLETLNQKPKAEESAEEEKPVSADAQPSTSKYASVAKQQIPKTEDQEPGKLVIDEDPEPVANNPAPRNEMKIFPDNVKWTPALIFDWDLEDEDKESISSDDETASEGNTDT